MSQFAWTFPGGKKTIQKAAAIVGNVTTTKTVPAGKLWLLLNISVILTADGNAANRYVKVETQDAANVNKFTNTSNVIVATEVKTKNFSQALGTVGGNINGLGLQLLEATEDVVIYITDGLVGDAYDYLLEYLEIDAP